MVLPLLEEQGSVLLSKHELILTSLDFTTPLIGNPISSMVSSLF